MDAVSRCLRAIHCPAWRQLFEHQQELERYLCANHSVELRHQPVVHVCAAFPWKDPTSSYLSCSGSLTARLRNLKDFHDGDICISNPDGNYAIPSNDFGSHEILTTTV